MVLLDSHPFDKLRLPLDETAQWKAFNPTFHRSSNYGIVLTDRALYLFYPFWPLFTRWRRIPLSQIRDVEFKNSRFFPSLSVETTAGGEVLRTPWDDADEMDYDRENLKQAIIRVRQAIQPIRDEP